MASALCTVIGTTPTNNTAVITVAQQYRQLFAMWNVSGANSYDWKGSSIMHWSRDNMQQHSCCAVDHSIFHFWRQTCCVARTCWYDICRLLVEHAALLQCSAQIALREWSLFTTSSAVLPASQIFYLHHAVHCLSAKNLISCKTSRN